MDPSVRISLLVTRESTASAPLVLEDLHTGARQPFDSSAALLAALAVRLPAEPARARGLDARSAHGGLNPA